MGSVPLPNGPFVICAPGMTNCGLIVLSVVSSPATLALVPIAPMDELMFPPDETKASVAVPSLRNCRPVGNWSVNARLFEVPSGICQTTR